MMIVDYNEYFLEQRYMYVTVGIVLINNKVTKSFSDHSSSLEQFLEYYISGLIYNLCVSFLLC